MRCMVRDYAEGEDEGCSVVVSEGEKCANNWFLLQKCANNWWVGQINV